MKSFQKEDLGMTLEEYDDLVSDSLERWIGKVSLIYMNSLLQLHGSSK